MKDFANFKDSDGIKIDRPLLPLVIALNTIGIKTTGSCSGHVTSKLYLPTPYILIETRKPLTSKRWYWKNQSHSPRVALQQLLNKFYKDHKPTGNSKLKIRTAASNDDFLYSGGTDFIAWRRKIDKIVKAIKEKKSTAHFRVVTKDDRSRAKKNLSVYQKETKEFAKFLMKEHRAILKKINTA